MNTSVQRPGAAHPSGVPARLIRAIPELIDRDLLVGRYLEDPVAEWFSMPSSDRLSIVVVTSGHYRVESRGSQTLEYAHYRPGSIGITAPGRVNQLAWRSTAPAPMESLQISVPSTTVEREMDRLGVDIPMHSLDALHRRDAFLHAIATELDTAMTEGAPADYTVDLVSMMLSRLLRASAAAGHTDGPAPAPGPHDAVFEDLLVFIQANLHERLTVADLAARVSLSPFHFLRMFTRFSGVTPHRYLVEARLKRAAARLRNGGETVAEIAAACGYSSRSQFAAAFTQQFGVDPSGYRSTRGGASGSAGTPQLSDPGAQHTVPRR